MRVRNSTRCCVFQIEIPYNIMPLTPWGWEGVVMEERVRRPASVLYDFDPQDIKEGVYKVTFWTTGREFKIHTTDYSEVGAQVGLTFFPEDIHVMSKVVYE